MLPLKIKLQVIFNTKRHYLAVHYYTTSLSTRRCSGYKQIVTCEKPATLNETYILECLHYCIPNRTMIQLSLTPQLHNSTMPVATHSAATLHQARGLLLKPSLSSISSFQCTPTDTKLHHARSLLSNLSPPPVTCSQNNPH